MRGRGGRGGERERERERGREGRRKRERKGEREGRREGETERERERVKQGEEGEREREKSSKALNLYSLSLVEVFPGVCVWRIALHNVVVGLSVSVSAPDGINIVVVDDGRDP